MASPLFAPPSAASALAGETPTAPGVRERDRAGATSAAGAKPVKKEAVLLSGAARARYLRLMSDPTLVMLDEPMAGVNPALTQSLLDHILDLKTQGMTVLFVEHEMQMVRHIADWLIVMAEGKIVAEGPPDAVMSNPAVIDAYLGSHHDQDLGVDPHAEETMHALKDLLDDEPSS